VHAGGLGDGDGVRLHPRGGETFTTLEIKVNYLRPVFEEKLFASAKVVHRGRSVGLVECDVTTENGKLVARAVSTCSVLRGEKAEGR